MKTNLIRYTSLIVPFLLIISIALYLQKDIASTVYLSNSFIDNLYFLVSFLILPFILAPITEEIIFRGFLTYKKNQYIASISLLAIIIETLVLIYNQTNIVLNSPYTIGNVLNIKLGFLPQIINIIIFGVPGLLIIFIAILALVILPKRVIDILFRTKNKVICSILFILSILTFVYSHPLAFDKYFVLIYYLIFGIYLSFITYQFSLRMSIYVHSLLNLIIILSIPSIFIYISNSYFLISTYTIFIILLFISTKRELSKLALES